MLREGAQVSFQNRHFSDRLLGDDELIVGLQSYSQTGGLLAISTLRGERADNREWSKDPSTPAGRKPVKWAYNPTVARMSEKESWLTS